MKKLKIFIFTVMVISLPLSTVSAVDFGGSLASSTSYSTAGDGRFQNEEALGLWFESGRGEHLAFETKLDFIFSATPIGFYISPDYLKLTSVYKNADYGPDLLNTTIGRFTASDFSSRVINQKLDGASVSFSYPEVELSMTAGYTGLFFNKTGSLLTTSPLTILSKTDTASYESGNLLQSPRAVEMISVNVPQLFARQSLFFSLILQEDLRGLQDTIGSYSSDYIPALLQEGEETFYANRGGAVDTQYAGIGLSGPVIDSLYYSAYYYFGTGRSLSYLSDSESETGFSYQYTDIFSHMTGMSIDYYLTDILYSVISLSFNFATGDSDADSYFEGNTSGNYTQFTPITPVNTALVFNPGVSNIISTALSYSIKPLSSSSLSYIDSAQIVLKAAPFFLAGTDAPLLYNGINPDITGNYLGTEIDLTMNFRPFSDLGGILQTGLFLPASDAFAEGSEFDTSAVFLARLTVSVSY